jgi:hypothetical protein
VNSVPLLTPSVLFRVPRRQDCAFAIEGVEFALVPFWDPTATGEHRITLVEIESLGEPHPRYWSISKPARTLAEATTQLRCGFELDLGWHGPRSRAAELVATMINEGILFPFERAAVLRN